MKKTRATKTGRETSIVNGKLYFEDAMQCAVDSSLFAEIIGDGTVKSIRVTSLDTAWYTTEWIDYDSKVSSDVNVQMTLRREIRSGRGHWYAYRRVLGTLYKRYVGNDDLITQKRLLDVARALPTT
jgi:hypothetical protein